MALHARGVVITSSNDSSILTRFYREGDLKLFAPNLPFFLTNSAPITKITINNGSKFELNSQILKEAVRPFRAIITYSNQGLCVHFGDKGRILMITVIQNYFYIILWGQKFINNFKKIYEF